MSAVMYVGLDTATTTGIAFCIPPVLDIFFCDCKDTPVKQMDYICEITREYVDQFYPVFVMEQLQSFRNAKTVRSFLNRYGYIKWSLVAKGYLVEEVHPLSVRSKLGFKDKSSVLSYFKEKSGGLVKNDNQSDAIATALYQIYIDTKVNPLENAFTYHRIGERDR